MVEIRIIPATKDHAHDLAPRMRKADRDEVMAGSGQLPLQALLFSMEQSDEAWTAFIDGRVEVMFGVGTINMLYGIGAPWLLGSDAIKTHYRAFLRQSLLWKSHLNSQYSELHNMVDDRNKVSKRWLQWLGFKLGPAIDIGNGLHFREFWMRKM